MAAKRIEADLLFRRVGITFAVHGESATPDGDDDAQLSTERLIPFDIIPRVITSAEWRHLARGLTQRVRALNAFLADVYHGQEILRAGRIPPEPVLRNPQYRPEMHGVNVPGGIYAHIAGIDVVRAGEGEFYVLEDNLRVPSGVSYMLEDRKMMMRLFPELFAQHAVAPVEHYPDLLLEILRGVAPGGVTDPSAVLLTPGASNSAYFEHAFLAQQMGVELVEGQDLFVRDGFVYMRTTLGPQRVDVIYRRIDDDFLDPLAFRADSTLGVPGLLTAYREGNVTIANAIGTGIADDKSLYPYVPEMIRFYCGEEPLLANVPTWVLRNPDDCAYVLDHLDGAGRQGGAWRRRLRDADRPGGDPRRARANSGTRIRANPSGYVAQPTLALSTCPTFVDSGIAPRHVDLRPFVLSGRDVRIVPGGLTRVALREGSLVVNSSQGGGTKDTWVLEDLTHAEPHRRPPLLDGALRGARREPGAPARRECQRRAAAPVDGGGEPELGCLAGSRRRAGRLHRTLRADRPAARPAADRLRSGQPVQHRQLPAGRPGERPRRPGRAHDRDLGNHEHHLAGPAPAGGRAHGP